MKTFLQSTTTFLQVSSRPATPGPTAPHPARHSTIPPGPRPNCWLPTRRAARRLERRRACACVCVCAKYLQTPSILNTPTNFLQPPPSFLHTPTTFLQTPSFSKPQCSCLGPALRRRGDSMGQAWGRRGGGVEAAWRRRGGCVEAECICVVAEWRLRCAECSCVG